MNRLYFKIIVFFATTSLFSLVHAEVLFERGSTWKYLKGSRSSVDWLTTDFDNLDWPNGDAPFRYGDGKGGTLMKDMPRRYSTVSLCRNFEIQDVSQYSVLELLVNYDDGFIVWINGERVVVENAPSNSLSQLASNSHESGQFEKFEIGKLDSILQNGKNIISIQAFNLSLSSSDFLIDAELVGIINDNEPPILISLTPQPGRMQKLNSVTLQFSEPVRNINLRDLRLNGKLPKSFNGKNHSWTFNFSDADLGDFVLSWGEDQEIADFGRPPNKFLPESDELARYKVVDDLAPELIDIFPRPEAIVRELKRIRLYFNEPVLGFDKSDILINGQEPNQVIGFADGPWDVEFKKIKRGPVAITWSSKTDVVDQAANPNYFPSRDWSYTVNPDHWPGVIVINEFMASNQSNIRDEDDQAVDWIELKNIGRNPVNLSGWSITDDKARPGKWVFPDIKIEPNSFLVVFASGKNRRIVGEPLHTNFKLGISGGYIGVFSPELPRKIIHKVLPKYPEQRSNISYGLSETDQWLYFIKPTPGAINGTGSFKRILNKPKFSQQRGFFVEPFDLILSTKEDQVEIRFTTDYSLPTSTNGQLYSKPIPINDTTIIRAGAFRRGSWSSKVSTHTFVLDNSKAVSSLPVFSLVTDKKNLWGETGILEIDPRNTNKRGIAWERPVSSELFFQDDSDGFQVESGFRLQGGDFIRGRHTPYKPVPWSKYSFRLYFRGKYGESRLNYPLFPDLPIDEFEHVVLRAGMNDSINPFICDELCRRLFRDLGHASSRGILVNLLLNGKTQAYYNPTERIDINFMRSRHGGGSEWDLIAQFGEVREGDDTEWNRFKNLTMNRDLTIPTNFKNACELIDLDNFIDYIILCIYVDMDDWPFNNWRAGRERRGGAKWRFYLWDAERSFGTDGKQMLGRQRRVVTSNNLTQGALASRADIARIFQSFSANSDFRLRFSDRVQKHYFNGGALTDEHISVRHQELVKEMEFVLPNMSPYIGNFWIPQRREIVMEQMASIDLQRSLNAPHFSQHGGTIPSGFKLAINAPSGIIYYTVDGSDPRGSSAIKYISQISFDRHTIVKARTRVDGRWSALTEAYFSPERLGFPVKFHEVMYNPIGGSDYEFIELKNISQTKVNLSRYKMKGVEFRFKLNAEIDPEESIVLASNGNPKAFSKRYPRLNVYGWYKGILANGGEKLALENAKGQKVLKFKYNNKFPWPIEGYVKGRSLQVVDPFSDSNNPTNWIVSPQIGGSPGK